MSRWLALRVLGLACAFPIAVGQDSEASLPRAGSDDTAASRVDLGGGRFLGAPIVHGNLTVWPILGPERRDIGQFLSLAEAQEKGVARVTERGIAGQTTASSTGNLIQQVESNLEGRPGHNRVSVDALRQRADQTAQATQQESSQQDTSGTEQTDAQQSEQRRPQQSGWTQNGVVQQSDNFNGIRQQLGNFQGLGGNSASVGELVLVNDGDLPVVVVAGTVVKGGNQDRQIAQDFVVPPHSTIPVDAFCIEQGRWTSVREGSDNFGVFEAQGFVTAKNVRVSGQYLSNQNDVWSNVAVLNGKTGKAPTTGTFLATAEDSGEEAQKLREALRSAVRAGFDALNADEGRVVLGFAYSVNGEPIGARSFANHALFEAFFPVFLNTMCIEAQTAQVKDLAEGRKAYARTAPVEAVRMILANIEDSTTRRNPTPGLNDNVLRANDWGGNSCCVLNLDGQDVVLTEDWTAAATFTEEACAQLAQLEALGYTVDDKED